MRLGSAKSEQNRGIQCRKDTEHMKYYQEGRPFRQHQPPSNPDYPIRPYRWFLNSWRVASSTFASDTNLPILNVQLYTQRLSAERDLREHRGLDQH